MKGNKEKTLFRQTKEWKEFAKRLRNERTHCECCGTKSKTLQVHHMDPANYTDISDPSKFAVVCRSCHSEISRLERIKPSNYYKYNQEWVAFYRRFLLT